jgi:hypothetical protein
MKLCVNKYMEYPKDDVGIVFTPHQQILALQFSQ